LAATILEFLGLEPHQYREDIGPPIALAFKTNKNQ
jgi:hypothetical protein